MLFLDIALDSGDVPVAKNNLQGLLGSQGRQQWRDSNLWVLAIRSVQIYHLAYNLRDVTRYYWLKSKVFINAPSRVILK